MQGLFCLCSFLLLSLIFFTHTCQAISLLKPLSLRFYPPKQTCWSFVSLTWGNSVFHDQIQKIEFSIIGPSILGSTIFSTTSGQPHSIDEASKLAKYVWSLPALACSFLKPLPVCLSFIYWQISNVTLPNYIRCKGWFTANVLSFLSSIKLIY